MADRKIADLALGFDVTGVGRKSACHLRLPFEVLDLSHKEQVLEVFDKVRPDYVIHAAAMTRVDDCESQREQALRDNVTSTQVVVEACRRFGSFLLFVSTDYVFDGTKRGEYLEDDPAVPRSVYGETKWLAEQTIRQQANAFVIFRMSWLYGLHGPSFPRTILKKARESERLRVVKDQRGRPTYTDDVARLFKQLLEKHTDQLKASAGETFHIGNTGACSWAEFAVEILKRAGLSHIAVDFVPSTEYPRPARRPANSVLCLDKFQTRFGFPLRPWNEAIGDFIAAIRDEGL
jgi:dTDP-4-dehydrorhamnose reductase